MLNSRERSGRFAWDRFHGQRNAPAWNVDLQDGHSDLLVDLYDRIGIADKPIGELTDMDEAILMHPDIDKGSNGLHIGHHPYQAIGTDCFLGIMKRQQNPFP